MFFVQKIRLGLLCAVLAGCDSGPPPNVFAPGDATVTRDAVVKDAANNDGRVVDATQKNDATQHLGPQPEQLYSFLGQNISFVHADAKYVWWVHGITVWQGLNDGTAPAWRLGKATSTTIGPFRDDARFIYWLSGDRVFRKLKDAAPDVAAEEILLGRSFAWGTFDITEGHIYLVDAILSGLFRIPKVGGELETVVRPLSEVGDQGGGPRLSLIDGAAYAGYRGDLFRVDLSTQEVIVLSDESLVVTSMERLRGEIYVGTKPDPATGAPGMKLQKITTAEGLVSVFSSPTVVLPGPLYADEERSKLYFNSGGARSIASLHVDKDSGAVTYEEIIDPKGFSSGDIGVNADYIFWANVSEPGIWRIRKP